MFGYQHELEKQKSNSKIQINDYMEHGNLKDHRSDVDMSADRRKSYNEV